MDSNKKTTVWARVISFCTASAILATSLPFFQDGFGANLATVVSVWAWVVTIVGILATLLIAVAGTILLWTIDDKLSKVEQDKLNTAADNLTENKPRLIWSLPLTLYWIGSLAYVDWTGLLITYVLASILGYLTVYGLLSVLRNAVDKARETTIREY